MSARPADPARRETVGEAVARRAREGDPVTGSRRGTGASRTGASRTAGARDGSGTAGSRGARTRGEPSDVEARTAAPRERASGSGSARPVGSRGRTSRAREAGEPGPARSGRGARSRIAAAEEQPAGAADRSAPRAPLSPVHRRRRRVAGLVAGVVVLVGLVVAGRLLLFDLGLADVEGVEVTGTSVVPVDDVLAAAAVQTGGPLVAVDTAGIAARVAALPGVASVEVGRGWPHTVTVAVTERVAVAVADTPQGPAPVDASGVVYPAPVPPGVPRLTFRAVRPEDPSTRAALDVLTGLPEGLRAQVLTVDVSVAGGTPQVGLGLTEERQVRWGSAERGPEKASVLVALLTQPGRVYDVTSPELPTVRS